MAHSPPEQGPSVYSTNLKVSVGGWKARLATEWEIAKHRGELLSPTVGGQQRPLEGLARPAGWAHPWFPTAQPRGWAQVSVAFPGTWEWCCPARDTVRGPRICWTSSSHDFLKRVHLFSGFPGGSDSKEYTCNAGDTGSIPGWGRSPGGGRGSPLECSRLENPVDRAAWRATVHGLTQCHNQATNTFSFFSLFCTWLSG